MISFIIMMFSVALLIVVQIYWSIRQHRRKKLLREYSRIVDEYENADTPEKFANVKRCSEEVQKKLAKYFNHL